jgi:hypothetical protein
MPRGRHDKNDARIPQRRKRRTKNPTFNTYIYRVLKQVHPDVGLSNHAMTIMDNFVRFTARRLAEQAQILVDLEKARTYVVYSEILSYYHKYSTLCVSVTYTSLVLIAALFKLLFAWSFLENSPSTVKNARIQLNMY